MSSFTDHSPKSEPATPLHKVARLCLKDCTNSEGRAGYFQQQLKIYGKMNELCVQCGSPIQQVRIAQRASYFCPQCQL